MRILAIGDIHGCATAFDTLLKAVQPQPEDTIVTLGDYVDRGPDSKGIIDRLLDLRQTHQLVPLRGNHELMMVGSRDGTHPKSDWLRRGGREALASYSSSKRRKLADVPDRHWDFIENICLDWWESDTHFFVHATADANLPIHQQPESKLFWEKFDNPPPHYSGKVMVCGHTSQKSGKPVNLGHAICIDTRAYDGRWLTCLETKSGKVWQANQKGKVKTAWIGEF